MSPAGNNFAMKVLFLDVDGVLHPANVRFPRQQFRQDCLELLQQIVKETACAIVLSYVFSCFFDFFSYCWLNVGELLANFERPVLGWIDTDFCK